MHILPLTFICFLYELTTILMDVNIIQDLMLHIANKFKKRINSFIACTLYNRSCCKLFQNFNKRRSAAKAKTHGRGHKGMGQRMTLPPLGYEGGQIPFHKRIPSEPYYKDHQ